MIAPVERIEWSDNEVARELEDLAMAELWEGALGERREEERPDDEIARAAEALAAEAA